MTAEVKTTVVSFEQFSDYEFVPVASYYIKRAAGDFLFIHTRSRQLAQAFVDSEYGQGKYKVISSKLQKTTKEYTARG